MKTINYSKSLFRKRDVLIALALMLPVLVHAGGTEKQQGYWQKYEAAKQMVIQAWRRDADDRAYAEAIFELGKYQTFLLAAHVPADDERLVTGLAVESGFSLQSRYDYPMFAYRIFRYELRRSIGFELQPTRLFDRRRFTLYRKE